MEWAYWNVTVHPMHIHVNPFQVTELPALNASAGYNYTSWFEVCTGSVGRGRVLVGRWKGGRGRGAQPRHHMFICG